MFRRRPTGTLRAISHADRLAALGAILDDQRFIPDGLSILASGEGYVVVGYVPVSQGFQTTLGERTLEVTQAMLDEAFARR